MTPQFTTPCYVRIDDAQQRKEACERLSEMGYRNIAIKDDEWILTQCEYTEVDSLVEYMKTAIECFDIPTFLDLAAMRSDTDRGQWFISLEPNGMWRKFNDATPTNRWRRATAQEIIEWHKKNER